MQRNNMRLELCVPPAYVLEEDTINKYGTSGSISRIWILLRAWFQFIVFVLLVALGFPAAASAHGGVADEVFVAPVIASQSQAEGNAPNLAAPQYFEASEFLAGYHCTGACCCLGISHCAPCGPSTSALQSVGAGINYDPAVKRINAAYDSLAKTLDRKFSLERPPRL